MHEGAKEKEERAEEWWQNEQIKGKRKEYGRKERRVMYDKGKEDSGWKTQIQKKSFPRELQQPFYTTII